MIINGVITCTILNMLRCFFSILALNFFKKIKNPLAMLNIIPNPDKNFTAQKNINKEKSIMNKLYMILKTMNKSKTVIIEKYPILYIRSSIIITK